MEANRTWRDDNSGDDYAISLTSGSSRDGVSTLLSGTFTAQIISVWIVPVLLLIVSQRLWTRYICLSRDTGNSLPLPPGSVGLPFIGETLLLIFRGTEFFTKRRETYGNIFKTHLLGRPTIRIIGSQNVRKILLGEHNLVTTQWPTSTQMIFGEGAIALSSGQIHKERRKTVMRAFNQEALQSYVGPIQAVVRKYISKWCQTGEVLAYPECRQLAFSIAATLLVGFDIPDVEMLKMLDTFQEMTSNIFSMPICLPGTGLFKALRAREAIIKKLGEYEDKAQQSGSQDAAGSTKFTSVLQLLRKSGAGDDSDPSRRELLEAALELLFAGHETTASAACSTLLHLAKKAEVVERVCTELYEHGLLNENDGGDLTFDAINKLSYTNLVVREVLRLSPPIGGAFRKALKTFEIGGYQVPEGWTLTYSIRDTHQTSTAFDDVDTFNPDRWVAPHSDAARNDFLPFGSGSRACVGKEFAKLLLKVLTIELARNCSWFLVKGKTTIAQLPVPHPKDDMPIRIREVSASRRRAYTL